MNRVVKVNVFYKSGRQKTYSILFEVAHSISNMIRENIDEPTILYLGNDIISWKSVESLEFDLTGDSDGKEDL